MLYQKLWNNVLGTVQRVQAAISVFISLEDPSMPYPLWREHVRCHVTMPAIMWPCLEMLSTVTCRILLPWWADCFIISWTC